MNRYYNVYYEDEQWLCLARETARAIVGRLVIHNAIDGYDLTIETETRGIAVDIIVTAKAKKRRA